MQTETAPQQTIAENLKHGIATDGRVIFGPNGLLPSADPIAVEPLTHEQEKAAAEYQAQLRKDTLRLRRSRQATGWNDGQVNACDFRTFMRALSASCVTTRDARRRPTHERGASMRVIIRAAKLFLGRVSEKSAHDDQGSSKEKRCNGQHPALPIAMG